MMSEPKVERVNTSENIWGQRRGQVIFNKVKF